MNETLNQDFIDFLCKLLKIEPENRLSAEDAYDDNYFRFDPRPCPPNEIPLLEKDSHEYTVKQEVKNIGKRKQEVDKLSANSNRFSSNGEMRKAVDVYRKKGKSAKLKKQAELNKRKTYTLLFYSKPF